jgi:hypothetical protein
MNIYSQKFEPQCLDLVLWLLLRSGLSGGQPLQMGHPYFHDSWESHHLELPENR